MAVLAIEIVVQSSEAKHKLGSGNIDCGNVKKGPIETRAFGYLQLTLPSQRLEFAATAVFGPVLSARSKTRTASAK